jgi:hypothetical protein
MEEPHNYRKVGYSMILVAASLVVIGLLYLSIGDDVLYSDRVGKEKQFQYQQMLEDAKKELGLEKTQGKDLTVNLGEEISMESP